MKSILKEIKSDWKIVLLFVVWLLAILSCLVSVVVMIFVTANWVYWWMIVSIVVYGMSWILLIVFMKSLDRLVERIH